MEDPGTRIRFRIKLSKGGVITIYGIVLDDKRVREEFATHPVPGVSTKMRGHIHTLVAGEEYETLTAKEWLIAAVNDPEVEVGEYCPRCGESLDAEGERAEVAVGLIHANCMLAGEEVA